MTRFSYNKLYHLNQVWDLAPNELWTQIFIVTSIIPLVLFLLLGRRNLLGEVEFIWTYYIRKHDEKELLTNFPDYFEASSSVSKKLASVVE